IYIVVVWAEIIAAAVLSVLALRSGHPEVVAPLILALVAIHFFAHALVFAQPVLHLAPALITIIAVLPLCRPRDLAAPSSCCGILGAPGLLAIGLWCLLAGRGALAAG